MKIFGREPALIVAVIAAALNLVVALGLGLSAEQAALIVAAINAVGGAVIAARTRPIAPGAFTALVGAVGALVAGFGFEVPPEVLGAVSALVVPVLALIVRGEVSPAGSTS